jgi:hypothetical protein
VRLRVVAPSAARDPLQTSRRAPDLLCGSVVAEACSGPPGAPESPIPADGSVGVGSRIDLDFEAAAGDCPTRYDVRIGTAPQPSQLSCQQSAETGCGSGPLAPQTTYWWQVTATNAAGTTAGPVWSFTTGSFERPETYLPIVTPVGDAAFDMAPDERRGLL